MNAPDFPMNIYRSDMLPLSVRVSRQQHNKLKGRRALDGITVQEHVRRAIDHYLATIDAGGSPLTATLAATAPAVASSAQPQAKTKTKTRVRRR